ncbi:MAG: nicotinate (nicotinamide) nucleotide adenylyltransferase [Bacteroidetes bacterium]|nr:nicotinate (nicotinamide) nucleotide adenylyltransferase [Bacteroidota bacterium]MDA0935608.1 nicotinate (nicotinamide) nucleotide adenylyltransferase [Bacteroidota bacterium]
MKKIGLFFGSFNPIHGGHLAVAEFFAESTPLEEVWLVVSPQSPFKQQTDLMDNHHRLAMVQLAIEGKPKLKACDDEFNLPQPNYTIDTLVYLKKKYADHQFTLLLGADNLSGLERWRSYQQILEGFEIFVYPRSQTTERSKLLDHPKIHFFDAPLIEISATAIRDAMKKNEAIDGWLSAPIQDYIQKFNLNL